MAETDVTPERLAEWLWAAGMVEDFTSLSYISNAQSLDDAVAAAEALGATMVNAPWYNDLWDALRAEQADNSIGSGIFKPITWESRTPLAEHFDEDGVLKSEPFSTQMDNWMSPYYAEVDRLDGEKVEEPEPPPESNIPFEIGGIDAAAHFRDVINNPEFSPHSWGHGAQQSREAAFASSWFDPQVNEWREAEGHLYARNQFFPQFSASGETLLMWSQLSPRTRRRMEKQMENAGLLDAEDGIPGYTPGQLGIEQFRAAEQVQIWANTSGQGFEHALLDYENYGLAQRRLAAIRGQGSGRTRQPFSVPASMRQIPDYESITQEVTNIFRQSLGRDAEDWELGVLADNMKEKYQLRNQEMIVAARAAFNQSQSGVSGVMEVEVPNPQLRTQKFLEERYGDEILRKTGVRDTAATNQLMLQAVTQGARMVP